jgi:hypothetical protein
MSACRCVLISSLTFFALEPTPTLAQTGRNGRLSVTVADQTGAVLPAATVRLVAQEATPGQPPAVTTQSSAQGVAVFADVPPGRYTLEIEFPGFEKNLTRDVRVRSGENRQSVVMALEKQEDSVTVRQDAQSAAADPRARFGSALTREQIDALSDDPQEMRRQLAEMVGGDVCITMNWGGQAEELLKLDQPVVARLFNPVQDHVLDELLTKVPGFRQAYMEDGLEVEEYEEFGPVRYFRDMFIGAWQNALKLIAERRAARS